MDDCVLVRVKPPAVALIAVLTVLMPLALGGCGSKEPPPQPDEPPAAEEAALHDGVDEQRDTRAESGRRADRKGRGKEGVERDRRSRHRDRLREWASQHRYMRLTLEKIKPSAEQLTKLADMNWKHFTELQKKKAERPGFSGPP